MKRKFKLSLFFGALFLMFFCTRNVYAAKTYSLTVSGYAWGVNDRELMFDRIVNSELQGFSLGTAKKLNYDQEKSGKGINREIMNAKIAEAMEGATSDDLFFFYYSGHSAGNIGISLAGQKDKLKVYYDEAYTWQQLAGALAEFPGRVVVILDVCHAENFFTVGVGNLSSDLQEKFSCLLSCGAEEESSAMHNMSYCTPSGKFEGKMYGRFTYSIGKGLGFWNGKAEAADSTGVVSLNSLYDYVVEHISGFNKMTVKRYGTDIPLFRYKVSFDNTKLTMYPGQTKSLTPYSAGNKVTGEWKSSNKSVVSVSSKGKLTAKKAGTAIITVTVKGMSATCKVTVKNPTLTLGSSSLTLEVGKSKTIKATATGNSNKITWSSSNKSIATVNSSGKVTAKKAGSCTITAKANGITVKCIITVKTVLTASDINKMEQLINCFNVPVGFLLYPGTHIGERPSGLTQPFMAACSAWNVNDKYCSNTPGVDGYGAKTVKGKYVTTASKRLFGKSCSISSLPRFSKSSYLLAGYDSGNVIRYCLDSHIWPTSDIIKSAVKTSKTYDVTVKYRMKNLYTGKYEYSENVVFTLKYDSKSYYGFYVTGIRFL